MSTAFIESALADVRAQVWAAQATAVRHGALTWTGVAADAAEARRADLLAAARRCVEALDAVDRLVAAARVAEQHGGAARTLVPAGARYSPGTVPAWG